MKKILFKTAKDAKEYAETHYEGCTLKNTSVDVDYVDEMDDAITDICGETSAYEVIDDNFDTLAILAYWENGDDVYEVKVDGETKATFDNRWDALASARKHYEDADEEVVTLLCNGEDMDF